ncbi:hypothetical protein WJX81_004547 [Elliptochloris bilobata]|uniref:NADH dehydrogenase [ubiquinone] 1 beta subcomplex subunit 9 n=1 Tax=Elliptochloris bilobata TaxID=381761 RepID=A0AAW1S8L2_9CHLO
MVITPQHKLRVMHLYRHSLKHLMSWAIRRDVFASEAEKVRAEIEKHRNVDDTYKARRLVERGEEVLREYLHPDPYIVPYYPGGSLYERNPPVVPVKQQLDWGREDAH